MNFLPEKNTIKMIFYRKKIIKFSGKNTIKMNFLHKKSFFHKIISHIISVDIYGLLWSYMLLLLCIFKCFYRKILLFFS